MDEKWKKIGLFLIAILLNSAGYKVAQELRPEGVSLQIPLDMMIPFIPIFVIPYALYVPVVLLPFFLYWRNYKEYKTVALCLIAALGISIAIYLTFQTTISRPSLEPTDFFTWAVMQTYASDKPLNAFPSLHVGMSTLATLFVYRKRKKLGLAVLPVTVLIILSTVFIKQHVLLDVAGGLVLAGLVYWLGQLLEHHRHTSSP